MDPVRIESLEDPRIADYRNLKDAQLARDRDRFIVEGRGNLRVLLERSPLVPESILLSDRAWAALEAELGDARPDCPIFVASQSVLDAIVGFAIHRGVLSACARPASRDPLALVRETISRAGSRSRSARFVLLEGLTNHDNVGGILRSAMALGGDAVLLCPRSCDPLYRKAIRTSMGGSLVVPFARAEDFDALLAGLVDLGVAVVGLDPDPRGIDLADLDPSALGHTALLVGTEGEGISEAALARATHRARIDMEPGVDSLNVSVAAAIALHRFRAR
ncbi:MAG: RNA methyltransferase [bacterium]|nr:RNA methyltransferase [bacterium]